MNEFLSLVKERPDPSLKIDETICPYCGTSEVEEFSHFQTIVGGLNGNDPNHHWVEAQCEKCNKCFVKEYKNGNA